MPLQRVGFSGVSLVFNGTTEVYERICSNLSHGDIISERLGLRMGMDFRGQV